MRLVSSIQGQNIAAYEILIAGDAEEVRGITYLPMVNAARGGRTNLMRNTAAAHCRFDHLVFLDDDMFLTPGWFSGVWHYREADLVTTRILNLDGTRAWDRATSGGPRGLVLLNYDETDPFMYMPGGMIVASSSVWERVKWDERLGYGEAEDVVFSRTAMDCGFQHVFCRESVTIHNDATYTQIGRKVPRRTADGASTWLGNGYGQLSLEELIQMAMKFFRIRRMPEAVDCLRHAVYRRPDYESARDLLARIDNGCGGPVDSGQWSPVPII